MYSEHNLVTSNTKDVKPVLAEREILLRELHALPSVKALNRILELENPRRFVQELPSEDLFWLIKKIGEDDCLPLLELASVDQWQYLLDLEIWRKDRLDLSRTSLWMKRLQMADPRRLVRWLLSEGEALVHYHLFKSVEVVVIDKEDEFFHIPDGFFTIDGVFHIKVLDPEHQETIENILRVMASEDLNRYQALLLGLAGVLPAEMEEEMYRLRNVRLAEHSFLPFEEALAVYAPLDPEALNLNRGFKKSPELPNLVLDEDVRSMVPISPLNNTGTQNMLTEAISGLADPLLLDRIRLEFAGLCNQILSADGFYVHELDVLIRTCRKAASYLNLAIEKVCGRDLSEAEQVLRNNSLLSIFRVGIGLTLKLKWEVERWLKGCWFSGQDLGPEFWGEHWGGILSGLMEKRPRRYVGFQESEEYKDFEWLSDLAECLDVLRRLMVLDSLVDRLVEFYPIDEALLQSPEITFRSLLFNLWSRRLLKLEPNFSGIPLEQVKRLFEKLREGDKRPPFLMPGWEEIFVQDLISYVSDAEPQAASILKESLSLIWNEFREEYEWISTDDLDPRYSKYILITK